MTNGGGKISLAELPKAKKRHPPYFYPKDDTFQVAPRKPCAFRDDFTAFKKRGAVILGVSPDSVKSHDKFAKKIQPPISAARRRRQENRRSLRRLGYENILGP